MTSTQHRLRRKHDGTSCILSLLQPTYLLCAYLLAQILIPNHHIILQEMFLNLEIDCMYAASHPG